MIEDFIRKYEKPVIPYLYFDSSVQSGWGRSISHKGSLYVAKQSIVKQSLAKHYEDLHKNTLDILKKAYKEEVDPFDNGLKLVVFKSTLASKSDLGEELRKIHIAATISQKLNAALIIDSTMLSDMFESPSNNFYLDYQLLTARFNLDGVVSEHANKNLGDVIYYSRNAVTDIDFSKVVYVEIDEQSKLDYIHDESDVASLFTTLVSSLNNRLAIDYLTKYLTKSAYIHATHWFSFMLQNPSRNLLELTESHLESTGMADFVQMNFQSGSLTRSPQSQTFITIEISSHDNSLKVEDVITKINIGIRHIYRSLHNDQRKGVLVYLITDSKDLSVSRLVLQLKRYIPHVVPSSKNAAVDWYLMGESDFIIASGSSFSKSAAFRKKFTPYYDIRQGKMVPKEDAFNDIEW